MGFKTDGLFDGHTCKECGKYLCKNRRSLGNHLARSHKDTVHYIKDYVLKYYLGGKAPACACGCGEEAAWHGLLYQFNDYLNGHNPAGFRVEQPKWTEEQLERRGESIRRAYKERGTEISQKISTSVNKALDTGEPQKKLTQRMHERWDDPVQRAEMTASRKRVWAEQGDELRRKIFTPEFGRKISLANSLRPRKVVSRQENEFIEWIREKIDPDATQSNWIVMPNGLRKCIDVYLPSVDLHLEFDGVYWHGLDKDGPYDRLVLNSLASDLEKNLELRYPGLNFVRIRSDADLTNVSSVEDLIELCHHIVLDGQVLRDGTKRLANDEVIVSRESLLRLYLDDKDDTKREICRSLSRLIRAHVAYWGWFYPTAEGDVRSALRDVSRGLSHDLGKDSVSSRKPHGSSFLRSTFRSFWEVSCGPVEAIADEKTLDSIIAYRLGLNNSKMYEYTLGTQIVSAHETFDITLDEIRTGFVVARKSVSFFKPTAAAEIYRMFLGDKDVPRVWDPSGGFGARMLGFCSIFERGSYVCCEPAQKTYADLTSLVQKLSVERPGVSLEVLKIPSEEMIVRPGSFDLVFTSPPYFDKERYYDEDDQCWKRYPTEQEWYMGYLLPTIDVAARSLARDGHVLINIDDRCVHLVRRAAEESGLELERILSLDCGINPFARAKGKEASLLEPILVFRKVPSSTPASPPS